MARGFKQMDTTDRKGWLYAMTNEGNTELGLVKVGMMYRLDGTWRDEKGKIKDKEYQESSSIPHQQHIFYSVRVKNCYSSEQELHAELVKRGFKRHQRKTKKGHTNSEMFEISEVNYPVLKRIMNKYSVEKHEDIHTDFNYGKRRVSRRKLRVLAIVILMLFVIASQYSETSQGSNYKTDMYGEQLVVEEIPEPVIQSFQFEFQKQIMTNEEIIAEVNAQIDKYKSEASPMRERNVHYLADSWDLSEELTSTPTSNPLSYSIFTETIDGKTVQIEFKTDGLKHMVGSSNYEILIT